jgi:hypothetical protein
MYERATAPLTTGPYRRHESNKGPTFHGFFSIGRGPPYSLS